MKLLISQKDELFDLIEGTNYFSPSQFEVIEHKKNQDCTTEIKFKNSEYFFRIFSESTYQGLFIANFSPGENSLLQATSTLNWNSGIHNINDWLYFLRRELTAQNKWERFLQEIKQINFVATNEQTKFSYQEYIDLTVKIDLIKNSLNTIPLLEEQQIVIINQLDHLTELAKELNKFDWKNLFIGTIVSIIIQLSVTHENAAKLWTLIKNIFSTFILN